MKTIKNVLSVLLSLLILSACVLTQVGCDAGGGGSAEPKVKLIDVALTEEEYAYVVKKGNATLTSSLNAYLASIKADGTFDALVSAYFKGQGDKHGYPVATGTVVNDETNLVVATNCPFEPFEYIGNDGLAYGLDIEIAAGYAAAQGLTLIIKNIGFDDIFAQVDAGYADVGMAGITVSESRLEVYDFSDTYYNASQKLIVAASCTDFDGAADADAVCAVLASLSGKSIGYQFGTTGGMYIVGDDDWGFDGYPNITGVGYATAQDAVNDLINGNLYAVIVDEAPAAAIVAAVNK
ncbi:MAG: transporter substrate-binding domain-containing protein [Clostridia bacterium]|nr:transporter substrate-binding domain-containing protein [Clostridia bacterium]